MILESQKAKLTEKVLKMISHHLSGREDCRDIEYVVTIQPDESANDDRIVVSPMIMVFPSTFRRKHSDRQSIAYHVIYNHFSELYNNSDSSFVHITKDSLVHGSYIYKRFSMTNRRRWMKLDCLQEV